MICRFWHLAFGARLITKGTKQIVSHNFFLIIERHEQKYFAGTTGTSQATPKKNEHRKDTILTTTKML
jgi:hypothetical protein